MTFFLYYSCGIIFQFRLTEATYIKYFPKRIKSPLGEGPDVTLLFVRLFSDFNSIYFYHLETSFQFLNVYRGTTGLTEASYIKYRPMNLKSSLG